MRLRLTVRGQTLAVFELPADLGPDGPFEDETFRVDEFSLKHKSRGFLAWKGQHAIALREGESLSFTLEKSEPKK